MTSTVAGQYEIPPSKNEAGIPESTSGAVVSSVDGKLVFDKNALRSKLAGAPVGEAEKESLIRAIIDAIRSLIQTVVNMVRSIMGHAPSGSASDSRGGAAGVAADLPGTGPSDMLESDEVIAAEGLPKSVSDRLHEVINTAVSSALGDGLTDSTKAALGMPDANQKQAFRVLLQRNSAEADRIAKLSGELKDTLHKSLEPFAKEYSLAPQEALSILRADLDAGGGAIAGIADPKGDLRDDINRLKQADAVLAGLAQARSAICSAALSADVYNKGELRELVAQYGADVSFLNDADAANDPGAPDNVFSLEAFRARLAQGTAGAAANDAELSAEVESVKHTVLTLLKTAAPIEDAATEAEVEEVSQSIAEAAVIDSVISDATAPDVIVEVQGDDLSDFFGKKNRPKTP